MAICEAPMDPYPQWRKPVKYTDLFWDVKFAWFPTIVIVPPPHPWHSHNFWDWTSYEKSSRTLRYNYRCVWLKHYLRRTYMTRGMETDHVKVERTDGLDCAIR